MWNAAPTQVAPAASETRPDQLPTHQPVRTPVTQPPPDTAVRRSEHVDKPWGHEEIFALVEGAYIG